MDNEYRSEVSKIIEVLSTVKGFDEFCGECYPFPKGDNVILHFRKWKEAHGGIEREENITLSILDEKFNSLLKKANNNKLSGFSSNLCVNDKDLPDFLNDFENSKTGDLSFKKANIQHYKTIREYIANIGVDIRPVYDKYKNSVNPYINAELALLFDNSGMYDLRLYHLEKAFRYAVSYPNPYWDTPFGIYGCTEAVFEVQYLLGFQGRKELSSEIPDFRFKIMELLYLYLSRSIHIRENTPQSANWLSNRANLLYENKLIFSMIFSENLFPGINIDIQFMSDKIYAYSIAEAHGLGIIFEQDKKDAYKMYQHDSLIPNNTGGLHDMEDVTFGELNKRGMYRSIALANKLYEKYQRGEYFLDQDKIRTVMRYIRNCKR